RVAGSTAGQRVSRRSSATRTRQFSDRVLAAYSNVVTAIPMAWYPLSTYTVLPVIPLARGEHRNAAAVPTSSASSFCGRAEFWDQYSTIHSMIQIALAARDV